MTSYQIYHLPKGKEVWVKKGSQDDWELLSDGLLSVEEGLKKETEEEQRRLAEAANQKLCEERRKTVLAEFGNTMGVSVKYVFDECLQVEAPHQMGERTLVQHLSEVHPNDGWWIHPKKGALNMFEWRF